MTPQKILTFMLYEGDIYVRPKLIVQPPKEEVIDISGAPPEPTYVCDCCGKVRHARKTPNRVKAGTDQWHSMIYQVCPNCTKNRAIAILKMDHPDWYVRIVK